MDPRVSGQNFGSIKFGQALKFRQVSNSHDTTPLLLDRKKSSSKKLEKVNKVKDFLWSQIWHAVIPHYVVWSYQNALLQKHSQ